MKLPTTILTEPYRLFFPCGWLLGILGATYWLLVSTGLIKSYAPLYHGLIQIELFCSAFAVGFLLTALPKFLRARSVSNAELVSLFATFVLLAVTLLCNFIFVGQWLFIVLLSILIRFAAVRAKERKAKPPFSFILVAFGIFQGLFGALLINYPLAVFPMLGQKFVEQGMFLCLSLGVGSFLGPRIMGVVDTINAIVSLPGRGSEEVAWYRSPATIVFAIGVLIFASFLIESAWHRELGLYLRAGASFYCLARFNVLKVPRSQSVVGLLTAVSLWSLASGTLVAAVLPNHEVGALHLTYIGGFGLLILTIGAQVISSHGLVARFWQIYRAQAIGVALLIGVSAICRVSATFFPTRYFFLLGSAALAFDLAMIIWGIGVLRYIGSGIKEN